jgi:4-aminobutyrate aminotransferase/(S)-3-amino-2-methylpropionate transaminase
MLEPVLGEGGFVVPPSTFMPRLRALCDAHGILLVADEVQSGFGRTGKLFACDHWGVVPDLITTAKSLAAGLPLSALTGRAEILDALVTGSLGGTYGGNPMACRAALAAIETLEKEGLVARAEEIGQKVRQHMARLQERHTCIGEVRGLGAMVGIELVDPASKEPDSALAARLLHQALQRGLLMLKSGAGNNVIRTLMPLVIDDAQLEEGLELFEQALVAATEGVLH